LSEEDKCKIIRVVEYNGMISNPEGLNIEAIKAHFTEHGSFENCSHGTFEKDTKDSVLLPCDILVPAAMEGTITLSHAKALSTGLIVEAANGPISVDADKVLRGRNVPILPDMFVNSGGVIVSYFEWVKNLTHIPFGLMERRRGERNRAAIASAMERMTGKEFPRDIRDEFLSGGSELDLVRSGLDDMMRSAYEKISDVLKERPEVEDFRTAAYVIAINGIANAYSAIGI
jgi:glutamate dehydrogenase (NAD(P)+)